MKPSVLPFVDTPTLINVPYPDALSVVYGEAPVLALKSPLNSHPVLAAKRIFDLLSSTVLILFVCSWIFPLMALLIRIESKGPVFFLQRRSGKNGRYFTCIKFRTMVINPVADLQPATADDPRITRMGKFLRRHHIDELPQLLNVWWGAMSMIGPRPHMISDDLKYRTILPHYSHRYSVKPGITGLAQVSGDTVLLHTPEQMKVRVSHDLYYIRHWSPMVDARILWYTLFKMAGTRKAPTHRTSYFN